MVIQTLDFCGKDLIWPTSFICSWKAEAIRIKEFQEKILNFNCPAANREFSRESGNRVIAGRYGKAGGASIFSVRDLYLHTMFGPEKQVFLNGCLRFCKSSFATCWSVDQPALFSWVRRSLCCYETKWHTTWYFMPWSEVTHCLARLLGNLRGWQQYIRSFSPTAGEGSALTIAFSRLTCRLCKTHV